MPKIFQFLKTLYSARRGHEELRHSPINFYLEVTNRCNLNCKTCARLYDPLFRNEKNLGFMSMELFGRIRPWLEHSLRVNTVGFGEPFLHPQIIDIMAESSNAGNYINVITNGTLLNKETIKAVVDLGVQSLVVSMDGGTREVFEGIRTGAKWEAALKALENVDTCKKRARSRCPLVTVEFVPLKSNLYSLPRLIEVIAERGVNRLHLEPLKKSGNEAYMSFFSRESLHNLPIEEVRKLFAKTKNMASKHGIRLVGDAVKLDIETLWRGAGVEALGHVDYPDEPIPVSRINQVSGWCLHARGIEKVGIDLNGKEIDSSKPDLPRPDVKKKIPGNHPNVERCGFHLAVPPSVTVGGGVIEVVVYDKTGGQTVLRRFTDPPAGAVDISDSSPTALTSRLSSPGLFDLPLCVEPWTTMFIAHNGLVYPCCVALDFPMGDLNRESPVDIWNGKRYRKLRAQIRCGTPPGPCGACFTRNGQPYRSLWKQYIPILLRL